MNKKKYILIRDVAKYLEVSRQSVYQWIYKGLLPGSRLPSGTIKILRSDFLAYLKNHNLNINKDFFDVTTIDIIIINDDDKVMISFKNIFKAINMSEINIPVLDLNVIYSNDYITGLLKIGELNPDVIILNMDSIGTKGLEICMNLQKDRKNKQSEIIAITENRSNFEKPLKELGIDLILDLPLKQTELRKIILSKITASLAQFNLGD